MMTDSPDDLIVISPITIKREHLPVVNGDSIVTEFEEPESSSSVTECFLLGENIEWDNTEVDHDTVVISSDDPLGDLEKSTVLLPECSSREIFYDGGGEHEDKIEDTSGVVNECDESVPQVQEVVTIKYEIAGVEAGKVWTGLPHNKLVHRLPTTEFKKKETVLKKVKTAICLKCNTGFPSTDLYVHHMSTVHQDERPYACKYCDKRFHSPTNCRRHETIHDPKRFKGPPQFACDLCDKRYHLKTSVESHRQKFHFGYKKKFRPSSAPITQHHSRGTQNPNPHRKATQVIPCPHCDLTFRMPCLLRNHMLCHTKEKKFSCPICEQPFSKKAPLNKHMRIVHEQETPSGSAHPTPRWKWKANLTYACTICNRVFTTESQHRYHMRTHSEKRSFECHFCEETYKSACALKQHVTKRHRPDIASNPLKLFKCLICGQDNFIIFADLCTHRKKHGHIPYESEKEKPFECGICGKPHFTRERAIICAILGHDSTSLRHKMFRHQCPACPPEMLGYRHLALLRKHWEEAHGDIPVPIKLRAGMYSETEPDLTLPSCTVDKKKAAEICTNGPPVELLHGEVPLFTERELLPIPKEDWFKPRAKGPRKRRNLKELKTHVDCDICGLRITKNNFKRHMVKVHGTPGKEGGRHLRRNPATTLTKTIVTIKEEHAANDELEKGPVPACSVSSVFTCRFCPEQFVTAREFLVHEKRHLKSHNTRNQDLPVEASHSPTMTPQTFISEERWCGGGGTVNVNDVMTIRTLLGNKCVRVNLFRMEKGNGKLTTANDATYVCNDAVSPSVISTSIFTSTSNIALPRNNEKQSTICSGDRWKASLGNKSLRLVLRRVDSK